MAQPKVDEKKEKQSIPSQFGLEYKFNAEEAVELPEDIDDWCKVALSAAHLAGEAIKQYINDKQAKTLSVKSNETDLVTAIDKKCEDIILAKIKSAFPKHDIFAEESVEDATKHNITDKPTWFIDPIDGTTNFVHGLPIVAVCIGLRINKIAVLGVVHCPILHETFYGILGKGSFLIVGDKTDNKSRLHTSLTQIDSQTAMRQALVLTEVGYDRSEKWVNSTNRRFYDLLYKQGGVRSIRMLGSCAINMCWIACGRADIFFEGRNKKWGPKPWDFTAAEIIVTEAGGIVCMPEGTLPFDCTQGRVLCCNNTKTAQYLVDMKLYTKEDATD